MRITNLTATAFAISFAATGYLIMGTIASASCGGNVCRSNTSSYGSASYGSTSYGSTYSGSSYGVSTANCPAGTNPSSDGTCLITGSGSGSHSSGGYTTGSTYTSGGSYSTGGYSSGSYGTTGGSTSYGSTGYNSSASNCPSGTRPSSDGTCLVTGSGSTYHGTSSSGSSTQYSSSTPTYSGSTYSRSTPLASYGGESTWTSRNTVSSMSGQDATYRYGSGSISPSYSDGNTTIVPFTTRSSISSTRLTGMGANEFLSPTTCPVSVYNPNGGKVLGCYSVSKPAPVRLTIPSVHTVRVVRPIIYVRYPVPVPVPFPVYNYGYGYGQGGNGYSQGGNGRYAAACASGYASRYGNNWPGRPCG